MNHKALLTVISKAFGFYFMILTVFAIRDLLLYNADLLLSPYKITPDNLNLLYLLGRSLFQILFCSIGSWILIAPV